MTLTGGVGHPDAEKTSAPHHTEQDGKSLIAWSPQGSLTTTLHGLLHDRLCLSLRHPHSAHSPSHDNMFLNWPPLTAFTPLSASQFKRQQRELDPYGKMNRNPFFVLILGVVGIASDVKLTWLRSFVWSVDALSSVSGVK